METIYFKEYASIDIYNLCLAYVKGEHANAKNYRLGLLELKGRGETELIYSIALNVGY